MREFKNKIVIAPVTDIQSISGTTLFMKSGKTTDTIYSTNDIIPDETENQGDVSRSYSQSLSVICDKLSLSLLVKYRRRKVVVKLFTNEDQQILIGSLNFPARCSILPKLNTDILDFVCEAAQPLLS